MQWRSGRFPASAKVLLLVGISLIVGATIRLGEFPGRQNSARLWKKGPVSCVLDNAGFACLLLAAWLTHFWRDFENTTKSGDGPTATPDQSEPEKKKPARPT